MPDIPQEAVSLAAKALRLWHVLEHGDMGLTAADFEGPARQVLEAAAAPLGEHVAGKIGQHRDRYLPQDARRLGAWRRHFGIAARIAVRAFLTEDDVKRLAAEALARGGYVACRSPEGEDG